MDWGGGESEGTFSTVERYGVQVGVGVEEKLTPLYVSRNVGKCESAKEERRKVRRMGGMKKGGRKAGRTEERGREGASAGDGKQLPYL